MRFTKYNKKTELFEPKYCMENIVQKLGIIEDIMEKNGVFSLKELKEKLEND